MKVKEKRPFIVAIDFDETIAEYNPNDWRFPEKCVKDSKETINKLHEIGIYIIIWTCRENENREYVEEFMRKHKIHYDSINSAHPYFIDFFKGDSRKILADVYIDDKQVGGLPSWKEIYQIIKDQFKKNEYVDKKDLFE